MVVGPVRCCTVVRLAQFGDNVKGRSSFVMPRLVLGNVVEVAAVADARAHRRRNVEENRPGFVE